jgi:hypothetical protein
MPVTFKQKGKLRRQTNESSSVYDLVLEQFVEPLAETAGQRNDLLIVGDQQQQIAKSIVDSHAVSASSQVFFNHDSPLRGKFPVAVGREFNNDLLTADFHAHASQFTCLLRFGARGNVTRITASIAVQAFGGGN